MMKLWQRTTTDERAFADALADCLETADSPQAIQRSLARYPQFADRLQPLLETATKVRGRMAVPMRDSRMLQAREQFLRAAAQQSRAAPAYVAGRVPSPARTPGVLRRPLWTTFAPAIVAAALFVVALIPILALTSSSALPGDWNYGFKRSTERVRLALTLDPTDRLNLQLAFHQRRVGELERLAASGRVDPQLLNTIANESKALVTSVSDNRAFGPSEAEKVAQVLQVQTQVLQDQVAPKAPPALKPDVAAAVDQSQEIDQQAQQVVQTKKQEAVVAQAAQTDHVHGQPAGTSTAHAATPTDAAGDTSATPAAQANAAATGTPTATASATGTPTASATPEPSGTPSVQVIAARTPAASPATAPILVPSQAPPASVIVPPAPSAMPTPGLGAVAAATSVPAPVIVAPPQPTSASTPSQTLIGSSLAAPAPQQTPASTASPMPASTAAALPTPPPPPTPPPTPIVPPAQPQEPAAQSRFVLAAGTSVAVEYEGPAAPIGQALASVANQIVAAYITQPNTNGSTVYSYYPGVNDPGIQLQPGSLVTIVTKPGVPAVLSGPFTSPGR